MVGEGDGLRIEVLGPVRALSGPTELKLGPPRQRAVFAVLALRAGQPVTTAELVSAVWGQSAPSSADAGIHNYVSGLRRALEPHGGRSSTDVLLVKGRAGYTLGIEPELLDAAAFERLIGRARQGGASISRNAVALLDQALAMCHGEPLSGLPGPFAERERVRLTELRLAAIELRAEALLTLGEPGELHTELSELVHDHPLRERLRELWMLALYRSGRRTAALEAFREAHAILAETLGAEPGTGLRRLHAQILAQDPALSVPRNTVLDDDGADRSHRLFAVPAQVARRLESGEPAPFVGRDEELNRLRGLVDELGRGHGGLVWVEGDFGIGKSELLAQAVGSIRGDRYQLGWAIADELSARMPFQVILDCLDIDKPGLAPQPRDLAPTKHGSPNASSVWSRSDPALTVAGQILGHVDELCARAPLILIIDDMQWADEASVLLWHRLAAATRTAPLLLISAARLVPRRPDLDQLLRAIEAQGGTVLPLTPLTSAEALRLHETIIGASAGPGLRELVARTPGNPLYITELTDGLVREHALVTDVGTADLTDLGGYTVPKSLVATIKRKLDVLSDDVREALRWAALLGLEFTMSDVAAVTGKRPSELLVVFEEAAAAHVVVDSASHLAFRHPLLRQAFYDGIPPGARASLHRQAAEALASAGTSPGRVAEQLSAIDIADPWVLQWLADNHEKVSSRAPQVAADLLANAVESCPPRDPHREVLAAALVKVLFRLNREPLAQARMALAVATDPSRASEMRQLLATIQFRAGETTNAMRILSDAIDDPDVPELWRLRHKHLIANFRRGPLDDLDAAEAAARQELLPAAGDEYRTAHALQTLCLVRSTRGDHEGALVHIDKALAITDRLDASSDLRLDLLDNRIFALHSLDRLDEAEETLLLAQRAAAVSASPNDVRVPAMVHYFWTGKWDEALIQVESGSEEELAFTFLGTREPTSTVLLLHGIAAFIAGKRGDMELFTTHLRAAEEYAPARDPENVAGDFLLAAQAMSAARKGGREPALELLTPLLTQYESVLPGRHQWMPIIVRLAVGVGDHDRARRALGICEHQAAKEKLAGAATASGNWCRGMIEGDPEAMRVAADHYRKVGRIVELGQVLEDLAALLAGTGELVTAQAIFDEVADLYSTLAASWDLERADFRLSAFGIRRRALAAPLRSRHEWASLTPVEIDIARLVAAGHSHNMIANQLGLPPRTVQAHVKRLLTKLDTAGRDRLARRITDLP
ncbi:BTAD domain-containing putative transcriptional regulator [Amycolatopsis sp. NPDC049868]|uniref:BTAD domain-containing putative transcriptional regulator n=1 Tax=Amycolatopsis sp. NPDC049868 TaxID=3363934 RepID=UPI0037A6576A